MTVNLVPFDEKHLETYRGWVNDPYIGKLVDRVYPVTEAEHEEWYRDIIRNHNAAVFAIEIPNDDSYEKHYIGNVWLWNIDWRHRKAEVRILIGDRTQYSKGYGTESLKRILDFAFKNLGLHKVYAYVIASNTRAIKAFHNAGFAEEGVLVKDRFIDGKFTDVLAMAMLATEATDA